MRKPDLVTVAVAALLGCTSCTGVPGAGSARDALVLGGDSGVLCIPVAPGGQYTYAFDSIQNTTDRTVRVDSVALVGAKNVTAEGGYIAPILNNGIIGAMPGWPPEGPTEAFDVKKAMPTNVAGGTSENLVVHLKANGPADVKFVEVTYTVDGDQRRVRNSTELQIRDACF